MVYTSGRGRGVDLPSTQCSPLHGTVVSLWPIFVSFLFCLSRRLDERHKTPGHDRAAETRVGRRKQNDRTDGHGTDENQRKPDDFGRHRPSRRSAGFSALVVVDLAVQRKSDRTDKTKKIEKYKNERALKTKTANEPTNDDIKRPMGASPDATKITNSRRTGSKKILKKFIELICYGKIC